MKSTETQSLPARLLGLKEMLSKRLAAPLPKSYEERLGLLESHLREVTEYLERTPPETFAKGSEQVDQSIRFARLISAEIRDEFKMSPLFRMSDCDAAAAWGVGLITLGAIGGGPVGAIAGFGYGVALLAASC